MKFSFLIRYLVFIFFSITAIPSSFAAEPASGAGDKPGAATVAEVADPTATNKLWRAELFFEGIGEPIRWHPEEIRLVDEISKSLSAFIPPRKPGAKPVRNRNIALARILAIVQNGGKVEPFYFPIPYVFPSYFCNSFKKDSDIETDTERAEITEARKLMVLTGHPIYKQLVEIAFFLPPFKEALPYDAIRKHYTKAFDAHITPIIGKPLTDMQPFIHSEQGIIPAISQPSLQKEFIRAFRAKYNDLTSIKIHGIVLDILSYYSACDNCTNTLSLLPTFTPLLDQLKDAFGIDPTHLLSFWVTESSINPLDPEKETAQQRTQMETIEMPIIPPPVNKIYHRLPLTVKPYE